MGMRWGAVVLGVVTALSLAREAGAQEPSAKDQELETIKKRLEALEQERNAEKAAKEDHGAGLAEEKWYDRVKVGGGVRAAFRSFEDAANNGRNYSYDMDLDSGRFYSGGKITDTISATLNAEFTGGVSVLDAIAQFRFSDEFNIFVGRHLPACDRSDSDGPYYLIAWDFPELSVNFNQATNGFGRDDGVTFWGDVDKFKYWVGVYEGQDPSPIGNTSDHLLYAARFQYDFLDAEKGYYLSSTYHGEKSILALGLAFNYQTAVEGVPGDTQAALNLVIDALFEKKFEFGTPTLEAAYYLSKRGGYGFNGAGQPTVDRGEGSGFLITAAFLIPQKLGWGQLQPFIRYQVFNEVGTDPVENPLENDFVRTDVGVNYVMKGHDARIALVYSVIENDTGTGPGSHDVDHLFTIGTQVQF